jgi:hypothetical protein
MVLEDFLTGKKVELDLFFEWYMENHRKDPEAFPINESVGYWEEQTLIFDPSWVDSSDEVPRE